MLQFDKPWEGSGSGGYVSIVPHGNGHRMYYKSWHLSTVGKKLTTPHPILVACAESDVAAPADGGSGQGGSLARFTIVGDYLYTLEPNQLSWYRISANGDLVPTGQENIFGNKETICCK